MVWANDLGTMLSNSSRTPEVPNVIKNAIRNKSLTRRAVGNQGNIHFGGEHCSVNFQGYMEGGAEEGQRAASEILADLGVK